MATSIPANEVTVVAPSAPQQLNLFAPVELPTGYPIEPHELPFPPTFITGHVTSSGTLVMGPDAATTPEDLPKAAVKFDGGKARWDLIPMDALEQLAILYTVGALKYADRNWEKGFRWGRTVAAMFRHFTAWWLAKFRGEDGVDYDNADLYEKVGLKPQSHLVAVVWNALALLTFELRGIGEDDRPTRGT